MEKLSVVVISYNEEKNIGRCLDSVMGIADEIVLLDSDSTDNTQLLAKQKGAVVYTQPFLGYIEQKNKALQLASHNYVLSLDADEAIDEDLISSIMKVKVDFLFDGYKMDRQINYCGKPIRFGSWNPDTKLRLFDKRIAKWGGVNPHDRVELEGKKRIAHLKGKILHYSYESLEEHISQNNKFSTISAESYFRLGKKSNWMKIFFKPLWAFLHSYIIKFGFMDGFYGYIIAKNIAHLTFMKYYKLYAIQKGIPVKNKKGKS